MKLWTQKLRYLNLNKKIFNHRLGLNMVRNQNVHLGPHTPAYTLQLRNAMDRVVRMVLRRKNHLHDATTSGRVGGYYLSAVIFRILMPPTQQASIVP